MSIFAARYAKAFADVVAEFHLGAPEVDQQLQAFLDAWDESKDLREVFGDPSVPIAQKVAVVDAMQSKLHLAPQVRNLFAVLIQHDRITSVHEIVEEYRRELQARLGIHHALVTTARPLNPQDKAALLEQIGTLTKSKEGQIQATFHEDPSILGGVVVRIGSTVYDGSILGRVERLREALSA